MRLCLTAGEGQRGRFLGWGWDLFGAGSRLRVGAPLSSPAGVDTRELRAFWACMGEFFGVVGDDVGNRTGLIMVIRSTSLPPL